MTDPRNTRPDIRIGQGYDVHPLKPGRRLMLGGVEIPSDQGLDGFSDADVVLHALGDALLGAAGLADLGEHFPPGDPEWKDADSGDLLQRIVGMVREKGFEIGNCDVTVIAEVPRIAPFREPMRARIADLLRLEVECVSVKATTHEGLGSLGRGEGIAALAVALLRR